jgi:Lon protease-like protein
MDDAERIARALPQLPIFPLPGAVLLPHSLVPLHIFEPRYRKMTKDAAAGLRVLALANVPDPALMRHEPVPVLPVIGVGVLARVESLPDGRFNIVLRGVLRARIRRELPMTEPYRVVEAEPLVAEPATGPESAQALRQMVLALAQTNAGPELLALTQLAANAADPGDLADVVASALLADPRERQAVLEATSVERRLELVTQAAAQALAQSASTASAPN